MIDATRLLVAVVTVVVVVVMAGTVAGALVVVTVRFRWTEPDWPAAPPLTFFLCGVLATVAGRGGSVPRGAHTAGSASGKG